MTNVDNRSSTENGAEKKYQTIGSIRSFQFEEENRGRTIDENMKPVKEVAKRL